MLEFGYYSGQTISVKFWTRADDSVQQGASIGYTATASTTVTTLYRANPSISEVPIGDYYVTIEHASGQGGSFFARRLDADSWLAGDSFGAIDDYEVNPTITTIIPPTFVADKVWDEDLVLMLRAEIGDFDEENYSDSRLKQVLVYAAYSVYQSAKFLTNYSISVANVTISPDPVSGGDYDFCVLVVYKAACIILTGEAKNKGSSSVAIKDGPSFFDNRNAGTNLIKLMQAACKTYNDMLYTYQLMGSEHSENGGLGQAILSPYSPGSFLMNWTRVEHRGGGPRW